MLTTLLVSFLLGLTETHSTAQIASQLPMLLLSAKH